LAADTPLDGYYTEAGGVYTPCDPSCTADGTTTYYQLITPASAAVKAYKIIKVQ
jgi:hypothetical protein